MIEKNYFTVLSGCLLEGSSGHRMGRVRCARLAAQGLLKIACTQYYRDIYYIYLLKCIQLNCNLSSNFPTLSPIPNFTQACITFPCKYLPGSSITP